LPGNLPTQALECAHNVARAQQGQGRHQTATSTSRLVTVNGMHSSARTRSNEFPIGKTTHLAGGTTDQTLYIRDGCMASGWHLATPTPGMKHVSDVFNLSDYNGRRPWCTHRCPAVITPICTAGNPYGRR
jgi:hypothetical protein